MEQSLALRREADAPEIEIAESLSGLCQLLVALGDAERVEPLATDLHELGRRQGAQSIQQGALHYLADCPLMRGDYAEAEVRYGRAIALARELGMRVQCTNDLIGLAMAAAGQGDHARAVRLATAAYEEREALGLMRGTPMTFWGEWQRRFIGGAREQLSPQQLAEAEEAGRAASYDAVLDEVLTVSRALRARPG